MKSKKRRVCLLMLISTVVLIGSACSKGDTSRTDKKLENQGKAYVDQYQMSVSLDTENKVILGTVKATLQNATEDDLKTICVRNWAAAILKGKQQTTEIFSAKIDDRELEIESKEDPSVVYLSDHDRILAQARESITVEYSFRTGIPEQKNRFGYVRFDQHEMYQLSFCFPQISRYQEGQWNENPYVGDSDETYVNEVADYEVTLEHPNEYEVAATGTEQTHDGKTVITGQNMREFAAVVSDHFDKIEDQEGGIPIFVYGPDYKGNRNYYEYSMQLAKEAVRIYTEKIGAYPFSEIKLVHCFSGGAMEYPGLCMIGMPDVKDYRKIGNDGRAELEAHVPHEIAHQWFYAAVGNDSYKEPWLDEGFSEFCEDILLPYFASGKVQKNLWKNMGYQSTKDLDKWLQKTVIPQTDRTKPINRNVSDYRDTEYEYSECVYEGGKLFLYELWKEMGDQTFFDLLKKYYETYRFQIATTDDFLKLVRSEKDDEKVEKIIRKYVETN